MENPVTLFDIIMPTYHPDLVLLRKAIESIQNQTFRHWRLIVVKDGGDEDLHNIVRSFSDERIKPFELPHNGKSSALNYGIRQGNAKYVTYLDDDDIWYPNHLEVIHAEMQNHKRRFVYTDAHEVFLEKQGEEFKEVKRQMLGKGLLTELLLWYISHINAAHERSLFDEAGQYDENRSFFIDWDMFIRMAKICRPYRIKTITCCHYMYNKREQKTEGTISNIHTTQPELSRKAFNEMIKRGSEVITADQFVLMVLDYKAKNEEVIKLRHRETELVNRNKELSNAIATILNSMSWKLTQPLRWLFHKVLGL